MINEYAHVTIVQDSKTGYKIKVTGNSNYILGGLAVAVAQTISGISEKHQQEARVKFLQYLNRATNDVMEE